MISFGIRNLKVFLKDKAAVFFSLMGVFIIIGLYALFLGDIWVSSFDNLTGVRYLMDTWIMAGLLAVTSVTTTMGAFGIMIDDKVRKITKDFSSSPIKKRSLVGGYIFSAVIIGLIMTFITFVLAEIYILMNGGELINPITFIKVSGLIILTTFANSSIILFIVSFVNSLNAFSTASTIIGTLIGFLTGIYLPIGNLPNAVQWVVKCFPVSHAAVLFRRVMMEAPMEASFNGVPADFVNEFELLLGIKFEFGDTILSPYVSILVLVVTTIVFFSLSLLNLSRKRK